MSVVHEMGMEPVKTNIKIHDSRFIRHLETKDAPEVLPWEWVGHLLAFPLGHQPQRPRPEE